MTGSGINADVFSLGDDSPDRVMIAMDFPNRT